MVAPTLSTLSAVILLFVGYKGLMNCLNVTLNVNPTYAILNEESDMSVIVDPKENSLCVLYMGDGNCSVIMTPLDFHVQMTPTSFGGSVGYAFSEKGVYNNTVVCENNGTTARAWDITHIIDAIEGLQLIPLHTGPIIAEVHRREFSNIFINFTFTSGERLSGSYEVDAVPMNSSSFYFDEEGKTGYLQLVPDDLNDFESHSVFISLTNDASWGDLSVNVSYQQAIEGLTLDINSTEVLVNSTIVVSASSAWGMGIGYQWTVNGVSAGTHNTLTHEFTATGVETISVNVSNDVGHALATKAVQVVNPVLGFQAWFSPENIVDIVLQAPPGEYFPMGSLAVELSSDYASQPAMNISAYPLVNITVTSRLSGRGDNIQVRIFSKVSEQILSIIKPSGLKFIELWLSSNPMEEDTEFQFVLQRSVGLNFSYLIDFGDGKSLFEFTSSSSTGDVNVTHKYTLPGEYRLQVNMSGNNDLEFRDKTVHVKSKIPDFEFSSQKLSNALATFSTISSTPEQPLTNISCYLDYGDGSAVDNFTWEDVTSRMVQHRYNQSGRFQSMIVCSNDVTKKKKSWIVQVFNYSQEDFVISYDNPVAMNSSANAVEVMFTVDLFSQALPPSGVTFTWGFGDETPEETEPLTSWVKTHNYTSRGTFNISVNISLAESSWRTRHLPIKIGIVTVSTSRSIGVVDKDVFSILVSADVHGGRVNYRVDFGDDQVSQAFVNNASSDYVYTATAIYQSPGSFFPEVTVWNSNFTEHHVLATGFIAEFTLDNLAMNLEPSYIEQSSISTLIINLSDDTKRPSNVSCSVNFGDGSDMIAFEPDLTQQFRLDHEFETLGQLAVDVNCASVASNRSETLYVHVYTKCYGFVRPFSTVESPVKKLVSQQLTLTANPDIQCANMTAEFYWSLDALANGSDIPLDISQPNSTVLVLGRRSMKPGTYRITFYTNFRAIPTSYSSDSVIVIYTESPLMARIKGGTLKSSSVSWPITLDAVTFSGDPDTEPWSVESPMAFRWTYAILDNKMDVDRVLNGSLDSPLQPCPSCLDVILKPQGVLVLTPGCLAANLWHVFTVNVSKPGRSAQYTQIIHVVDDDPPQVDIRCKVNCFKKVNAEFSYSLETECLDCGPGEVVRATYSWVLYQETYEGFLSVTDFAHLTSTGTRISTMSIRPNSLLPGNVYCLVLQITDLAGRSQGSVTQSFVVNYPPYNGTCLITPDTGYAALDSFHLECQHWLDEGMNTRRSDQDTSDQLWYQFLLLGDSKPYLLYAGDNRRAPAVELTPGREEDDYHVTILATIYDTNNGMAQFNLTARVLPPLKRYSAITNKNEVNTVIGKLDNRLDRARITRDIATVARVTQASASVLNVLVLRGENSSLTNEPDPWLSSEPADLPKGNESAKTWGTLWTDLQSPTDSQMKDSLQSASSRFAESLSSTLDTINVTSTEIVHHVSGSLSVVMENPSRIPDDALNSAGKTLAKLGNSLKDVVREDMSDTHVGTVLDAMLHSLAGVMRAANPGESVSRDITSVSEALREIEKSRSYKDKDRETMLRLEKGDLRDEERAFLYVRKSAQRRYEYNKRRSVANAVIKPLTESVDRVLHAASTFLVMGQQPVILQNADISASVGRDMLYRFLNRTHQTGNVRLYTHTSYGLAVDESVEVMLKTSVYTKNPFLTRDRWESNEATAIHMGYVFEEGLTDDDRAVPNISLKHYIAIPVPEQVTFKTTIPKYIPLDRDQLLYHRLELPTIRNSVIIYLRPSIATIEYEVFFRSGNFPTAKTYDYRAESRPVGPGNDTWRAVCPKNSLPFPGTIYVGLKPKPLDLKHERRPNVPESLEIYEPMSTDSANFSAIMQATFDVGVVTADCSAWEEGADEWDTQLCELSEKSTLEETICACDHPVLSILNVAQSFVVPVSTIDFSTIFAKIDLQNNSSVFACVLTLLGLYAMLAVWARRKDQSDVLKWGITSLTDNHSGDRYLYIITVYTGMRLGAGTRSRVGFAVVGEDGDTGVRLLDDGIRKEIPSRSIMHFLLAVPRTLGNLQYMRVWHDNSGQGSMASWFLHKVVIEDLQTDRRYIFNCGRWLAVEKDDGMIERLLPVTAKQDLVTFKGQFYNNTRKNFTDNHLWFSVILRPQRSQFTRLQRLSCCLSLLFLAMLSNAMFYHTGENVVNPTVVNMGIFRFSLQQLYVSVICLLIVTPVNILIVWMFKKSKTHWHKLDASQDQGCGCCAIPLLWRTSEEQKTLRKALVTRGFHSENERRLPHFCVYIAWVVVLLCVTVSAFFLFLYSQQWGKAKTEEWLTSFLLSFIESLFVVDPLKVLVVAALFAIFIRKPDESASEGFDKAEIKSRQPTTGVSDAGERKSIQPLSGEDLKKAQTARHKETKAYTVLREIILYIIFLFIVYTIGYSNRDNRSFIFHQNMLHTMLTPKQTIGLTQVHTTETFFQWVNETVFPALFQENYYQGSRRRWWERYYIRDWQNYRVGPPRIRQLRSPTMEMCFKKIMGAIPCSDRYHLYHQEARDFCLGWKEPPCPEEESVYQLTSNAWKFTSFADALSMPVFGYYNTYSGGGYIAELDVNLDVSMKILEELFSELWVDRQTRAVIIEYTVFNANTNMFCYVNLMAEFPETGGVLTYYIIRPFRIYQHTGALGAYIFFNEVIFAVVVFIALIKVILKLRRLGFKYFNDFWHINEFFCLLTCLVGITIYVVREVISRITMTQFRANPKRYVSFYHITIWDEVLVIIIGFLSFICTVRMIRILGYSKRSSDLMQVLKNAGKDLYYFSIMFFLLFAPFAIVAFVIFGPVLEDYRDMLVTTATLIMCMIGRSPFTEMRLMEPFFAQVYFGSFIFFEVFILLTMFLAILNESISAVRADQDVDYTQHDMLDLLIGKVKNSLGLFLPKRLKQVVQELSKEVPTKEPSSPKTKEPDTKGKVDTRVDILKTAAEVLFMKKALESKQKSKDSGQVCVCEGNRRARKRQPAFPR